MTPASSASPVIPTDSLLADWPIDHEFLSSLASYFLPPPKHTLSSWAEANITLSSEYAARASRLVLFGWQREIFDAFTDPLISEVVLMVGTQLVKTLYLQCAMAYVVCVDPGPILFVEPNDDDAKTFSKERLGPMIRDNDSLRSKMSESREVGLSTLTGKIFPGGSLSLVGSIAPSNLARRSIRYLFCDEIDKFPASAGKEGDPILLAEERLTTYGSRKKKILCCSPTVESTSRIGKAYATTDQRRPYVPCPTCGTYQVLKFTPNTGPGGVWFDSSLSRERRPETAVYLCTNSECPSSRPEGGWKDYQRKAAVEKTVWRATKPFNGRAGFWLSHLYSPWKTLGDIVDKFLTVKDIPDQLKTFVNTNLAEQWKDVGDMPDYEVLYARREAYPFGSEAVVPQRGLFLTAFVDVQDSPARLEVEVVAWGRNRECWSICYDVIQCFTDDNEPYPVTSRKVWDELATRILARNWLHESGKYLPILVMGVDTGNRPKPVYEFASRNPRFGYNPGTGMRLHAVRTVIPTKGAPDPLRILSKVSKENAARMRQGIRILHIGTHAAKQEIFDALRNIKPSPDGKTLSGHPVPACFHHPGYDLPYFLSLTAEARVVEDNDKVVYTKIRDRNDALDCKVGNRAMASVVGIDRFTEDQWRQMEEAVATTTPVPDTSTTQDTVDTSVDGVRDGVVDLPPSSSVSSTVNAGVGKTTGSIPPVEPVRPAPASPSQPRLAPPAVVTTVRPVQRGSVRGRFI